MAHVLAYHLLNGAIVGREDTDLTIRFEDGTTGRYVFASAISADRVLQRALALSEGSG